MRIIIVSAFALLTAANAAADGRLMKYRGLSHYTYDYQTGEIARVQEPDTRRFNTVWDISTTTGYFTSLGGPSNMAGVWGDMDPTAGDITSFTFGYATSSTQHDTNAPGPIGLEIVFYDFDNGRGDLDVQVNEEFVLTGLPGDSPDGNLPDTNVPSFIIDVTGFTPFNMRGSADEDVDGLPGTGSQDPNHPRYDPLWHGCQDDVVNGFGGYLDFGYTYLFRTPGNGATGAILTQPGEPNMPCPAPGAVNNFDVYNPDPNNPVDPNKIVHKAEAGDDQAWRYSGSFMFNPSGNPFAGFYLTLSSGAECPDPACDAADIDGDCLVDLFDLATLLGNFGTADGATLADGDLDDDGDVDLTDLAVILSAFGTDCR